MQHKVITIIGAGNVGYQLALALYGKGYEIHQVFSRDAAKAKELAVKINAQPVNNWGSIDSLAEVYIFCLSDDVLQIAAQQVKLNDKIVCHTAGSVEVDVLLPVSAMVGVLYPLQTISKNREVNWHTVPMLVESSDEDTLTTIEDIAKQLSEQVYNVTFDQRRKAHLAAVFANNFPNNLWAIAEKICAEGSVSFDWMKPLILETVNKAMDIGPTKAQTGPALRDDKLTMDKHLALLKENTQHPPNTLWTDIYEDISKSIKNS